MNHRSHRGAKRLGLLTATSLAALALAAPAVAAPLFPGPGPAVLVHDRAYTHADRVHPDRYADSFTVRQLGSVGTAHLDNRATAISAGCLPGSPCRSVALSFQIVTLAGPPVRIDADNLGRAVNDDCPGCQTLAGAYQFIVSTSGPFRLSVRAMEQLGYIHHQLDELGTSGDPIATVHDRADALAEQVAAILRAEAAAAPKSPAAAPLAVPEPEVTVHRHYDQQD